MSNMETVIVVAALAAFAGGGLILLNALAAHRRHLYQALKIEIDTHEREQNIKQQEKKQNNNAESDDDEEIVTIGTAASG